MAQQLEVDVSQVNAGYRGRVRTGCLTCRASKVRCDEQRPVCKRCVRLSRACVYKKAAPQHTPATAINRGGSTQAGTPSPLERASVTSPIMEDSPGAANRSTPATGHSARSRSRSELQSPVSSTGPPSLLSMMVSQDIHLCTTIDLMMANEMATRPSFAYFQHSLYSPYITPYDPVSWQCFKDHVVELAGHNTLVAAALLALESLYKAHSNGLSTTQPLSLYDTASTLFRAALSRDDELVMDSILEVGFLLHLAEMLLPEDTGHGPLGGTEKLLATWMEAQYSTRDLPPLTIRVSSWLLICHAAARRGGNKGMLSDYAQKVLRDISGSSVLPPVALSNADPRSAIFQSLSEPLYNFHFQLQLLSGRVADLSHYHRSRFTSEDQEEVFAIIANLKEQMQRLWGDRPSIMHSSPAGIRGYLNPHVSEPLLLMIAICEAIYHHEIVEIGRNLSDPPFASPEAREHLASIRAIMENPEYPTESVEDHDKVHAAFLRPLFLYAIESLYQVDTEWAVGQIRKIKDPISRSDFFASFAEGLATAQREKGRRVTTKWWCLQAFGVAPPYL